MHIMKKPRGPVKFQQRVQMHSIFMHCNMISALKVAEIQVANLQIFPKNKVATPIQSTFIKRYNEVSDKIIIMEPHETKRFYKG